MQNDGIRIAAYCLMIGLPLMVFGCFWWALREIQAAYVDSRKSIERAYRDAMDRMQARNLADYRDDKPPTIQQEIDSVLVVDELENERKKYEDDLDIWTARAAGATCSVEIPKVNNKEKADG